MLSWSNSLKPRHRTKTQAAFQGAGFHGKEQQSDF
jgi:hypothetical protein